MVRLLSALFERKPSLDHIRIFGCLCYAHNIQKKKDKFGIRSRRRVMVRYPYGKKDWTVYDIETGEIFVTRDIIFYEETCPFADNEKHKIEST